MNEFPNNQSKSKQMAEQSIQELLKKISELEKIKPFAIKEGDILYIYQEKVSDKFSKITVGLDAAVLINGKLIPDYVEFQITDRQKELYKEFDPRDDDAENNFYPSKERKYGKGDKIGVMLDVSSYQTNTDKKHDNRTCIYNNVNVVRCKMIEKATPVQEVEPVDPNSFFQEGKVDQISKDDLPF